MTPAEIGPRRLPAVDTSLWCSGIRSRDICLTVLDVGSDVGDTSDDYLKRTQRCAGGETTGSFSRYSHA